MYVTESKDKAILFAWSMNKMMGTEYANVKLKGLENNKQYKITEINIAPNDKGELISKCSFNQKVFSADYLMNVGINLFNAGRKLGDYQSLVFELELVN
jgi:alpha-galactosidase